MKKGNYIIPKTVEECADLKFLKQFDWRFDFQDTSTIEAVLPSVFFDAFEKFVKVEGMRFVSHYKFDTISGEARLDVQTETSCHRRGWLYISFPDTGIGYCISMLKFIIEEDIPFDKEVLKNDLELLLGMHEPAFCAEEDIPEVKRLLAKLS